MSHTPNINEGKEGVIVSDLLVRIRSDLATDRYYEQNFTNDGLGGALARDSRRRKVANCCVQLLQTLAVSWAIEIYRNLSQ